MPCAGIYGQVDQRPDRVAVVLGYVADLPALPLTHFVPPDDQAGMFEIAIGIATALYAAFAGFLGYRRPRNRPRRSCRAYRVTTLGTQSGRNESH